MSMNALLKYYNPKLYKQIEVLTQIMEADNYESFLWNDDISNYKKYPIDEIAEEILWLTPFRSKNLPALIEYAEKRMAITKHVKWKRETSKPHRGDLHKAIQRQFVKQRSKARQEKQQEKADKESNMASLRITIAANEYEIELINIIYDHNVPKTDTAYKEDQTAHNRMIELYENEGNHQIAQILRDNPLSPKSTYKDITYKLEVDYLKKHHDLPKQKFKEALRLKIKEVSKFAYPKRKYKHPTDEYQPTDDF